VAQGFGRALARAAPQPSSIDGGLRRCASGMFNPVMGLALFFLAAYLILKALTMKIAHQSPHATKTVALLQSGFRSVRRNSR
jgi:hypothetical protein